VINIIKLLMVFMKYWYFYLKVHRYTNSLPCAACKNIFLLHQIFVFREAPFNANFGELIIQLYRCDRVETRSSVIKPSCSDIFRCARLNCFKIASSIFKYDSELDFLTSCLKRETDLKERFMKLLSTKNERPFRNTVFRSHRLLEENLHLFVFF